jgi:hypothetical protein
MGWTSSTTSWWVKTGSWNAKVGADARITGGSRRSGWNGAASVSQAGEPLRRGTSSPPCSTLTAWPLHSPRHAASWGRAGQRGRGGPAAGPATTLKISKLPNATIFVIADYMGNAFLRDPAFYGSVLKRNCTKHGLWDSLSLGVVPVTCDSLFSVGTNSSGKDFKGGTGKKRKKREKAK